MIRSNTKPAIDQYQEKCPFCRMYWISRFLLISIVTNSQIWNMKPFAVIFFIRAVRIADHRFPFHNLWPMKINSIIRFSTLNLMIRNVLHWTRPCKRKYLNVKTVLKNFYRILKCREDFYEKSRILDCSLDDRLIELMKIYIVQFFSIERNQNVSSIRFQLQKDRPVFCLILMKQKAFLVFQPRIMICSKMQ